MKPKLVSPVLMWAIVLAGIFFAVRFTGKNHVIPVNPILPLLVVPAAVYWAYFFIGAMAVHRQAPKSAAAIKSLVTNGVYAKVRHPIYAADIVLAWAIFLRFPSIRVLASVAWLTAVLIFWMKLEEKALIAKFGGEYEEYRKRVPMILPRFK